MVLSKSNDFLYAFINIAYMFNMQTQQCVPGYPNGCGSDMYLEKAERRRELEKLLDYTVVSLKSGFE